MGKVFDEIDDRIQEWMESQKMFFVATAPTHGEHINCSPKGNEALKVVDGKTLAYLDSGGSGIETVAHIRENNRILIMMCAFDGPPKIMRFHGHGTALTSLDDGFEELAALWPDRISGIRNIIRIDLFRISDSCGWGVPLYDFQDLRDTARKYAEQRSPQHMRDYFKENSQKSLDGLPGLTEAETQAYVPSPHAKEDGAEKEAFEPAE